MEGDAMARIEGEIAINRPVDEVFDFVADERNEPRYNPRMARVDKLSPGPIGRGSRFRAEAASWPRTVGMTIEYTTYQRPRRLASSIRMAAADIQGTLTFDPVAGATRMRWSWEVKLRGPYRLASPLVAYLGRRGEQATWTGLKRFLEGRETLASETPGSDRGRRTLTR
jgi:uncharacterized protein YndB with AHSA1/START domain